MVKVVKNQEHSDKKSSQKIQLIAEKRSIFGKKLRKERINGKLPANIYGPQFKSQAITVNLKDFNRAYRVAEETGIIYLKVDKEDFPSLIKNVQLHPVSHLILHVDFRKIDLKQKIETQVPIKIVGESPAVAQKGGVLLTQTSEVMIESLPENIPHEIEVDVSDLNEIGIEIKVSSLPKTDKYTIKEDAEKVIVSVIAHKEESLAPETTAETPEVITAKPEEGAEGELVEPASAEATAGKEGKKEGAKPAEGKEPASAKAPAGKQKPPAKPAAQPKPDQKK